MSKKETPYYRHKVKIIKHEGTGFCYVFWTVMGRVKVIDVLNVSPPSKPLDITSLTDVLSLRNDKKLNALVDASDDPCLLYVGDEHGLSALEQLSYPDRIVMQSGVISQHVSFNQRTCQWRLLAKAGSDYFMFEVFESIEPDVVLYLIQGTDPTIVGKQGQLLIENLSTINLE